VDPLPYLRSYAKVVRPIPANEIYSHLLSILEKITGGLMSRLTSKESHFSLGASNRGGIRTNTLIAGGSRKNGFSLLACAARGDFAPEPEQAFITLSSPICLEVYISVCGTFQLPGN
jgi:hypothetical protein